MRFGQSNVLKTAKGKIAAGLAIFLFGVIAVLAAPTDTDRILCAVILVIGLALITRGIRQDREEKKVLEKEEKPKKRKRK